MKTNTQTPAFPHVPETQEEQTARESQTPAHDTGDILQDSLAAAKYWKRITRQEEHKNAALLVRVAELKIALENCVTHPGALSQRNHGFALQRLNAINEEAYAVLARK